MDRKVFGHIDCPSCGALKSMRITHDKNQEPFGYCEDGCGQQLRIGGNFRRVKMFLARFPWAAVTVTVTEKEPEKIPVTVTVPEKKPVEIPVTVTVTEPAKPVTAKKRSAMEDALSILGVK